MKNDTNRQSENKPTKKIIKITGNWPKEKRRIVLPGWEDNEKKIIDDQYNIMHIHVTNKFCIIKIDKKVHTLHPCISLKRFERMLDPELFFHTERAHNVNMLFVESYKRDGRCGIATLIDDSEVPVSYRLRDAFETRAKEFGIIVPG